MEEEEEQFVWAAHVLNVSACGIETQIERFSAAATVPNFNAKAPLRTPLLIKLGIQ